MTAAFEKPLQLVTGKGGVGKSTVVAALGWAASARGERPLVVELGHHATMGHLFEAQQVNFEPSLVAPGIHAMNIELLPALREFALRYVHFERVVDRVLSNTQLARFFQAAPGVLEVLTLSKIHGLVAEREGDRARWHPVIVDLDATGHALMLLDLPRVLSALVARGPLRRMLRAATNLLADPEQSCVHLVAVPRSLVVQETLELAARLRDEHDACFGAVIVNHVAPPIELTAETQGALERIEQRLREQPDAILSEVVDAVRRAERRAQRAVEPMERLASLGLPIVEVADCGSAQSVLEVVQHVARRFERVVSSWNGERS